MARLKLPSQSRMTEGAILMRGDSMENVGQTLGVYSNSNHVMVPSTGSGDVAELQALEKADQTTTLSFVTKGTLQPGAKYSAFYHPLVNGCRLTLSFSFTTSLSEDNRTPTILGVNLLEQTLPESFLKTTIDHLSDNQENQILPTQEISVQPPRINPTTIFLPSPSPMVKQIQLD